MADLGHDEFHTLVRVGDGLDTIEVGNSTVEERLDGLQEKITSLEKHIQDVGRRQAQAEEHIQEVMKRQAQGEEQMQGWQLRIEGQIRMLNERHSQIESMLEKLLAHLSKGT